MTADPHPPSFRKLLVVTANRDSDAALLDRAGRMAARGGASVQVLHVVERPPEIGRLSRALGLSVAEVEQRLCDDARAALAQRVAACSAIGDAEIVVRVGKTFIAVIQHILEAGTDLVLKVVETLHGRHSGLFASTDQHLLRKCPCPVWLVRHETAPVIRRVLAAIDVDEDGASDPETLDALNREILDTAIRIVGGPGAGDPGRPTIHLLHAWDAPAEGMIRMLSGSLESSVSAGAYVGSIKRLHTAALERLIASTRSALGSGAPSGLSLMPVLVRGQPNAVIPAQVEALGVDVLVMGTIARTGIPGFIIGNTAEDVLNSVECAVVTVKPPGYVSPLAVS